MAPEALFDWKLGGGVNWRPGLAGKTTGGCLNEGVNPNCPAAKLELPPGLVTWIRPSMTCTYKPGGKAFAGGSETWAEATAACNPNSRTISILFTVIPRAVIKGGAA